MASQETQIRDNIISSRRALLVGGGATTEGTKATEIFFPNGLNGLLT